MPNPISNIFLRFLRPVKPKRQMVYTLTFRTNAVAACALVAVFILMAGCAHFSKPTPGIGLKTQQTLKLFVVILDALQRKTLMESLDELPNFRAIIKGDHDDYPYIYFENVLVSIPSSSKPSNTTLLTGVYPNKHGVPATIWFDKKDQKIKTLTSISQRRVIDILEETNTDTIFDYALRSGKTTMAVATQVSKGVDDRDWIQQSVHLWGQAFCLNLLRDGNPNPDGAHLDRGTTIGLLKGHMYSFTDGLEGKLRSGGQIPDLTLVHYVGMDIFTHYPRRFMLKANWPIEKIQKWYLKEVLDPEMGKIKAFLQKNNIFDHTIFCFVSDHGQGRIRHHVDEENFEKHLSNYLRVMGRLYSLEQAEIILMPGAGTKTVYVKNRLSPGWMTPPRLIEDVKPVVDALIDTPETGAHLNALLVSRYPDERDDRSPEAERSGEPDPFWFFNFSRYRQSGRQNDDFGAALEPLSKLDELAGEHLNAACMYRRNFVRKNIPDIILINKPGDYFTPDNAKYAHHGSIYAEDAYVSFFVSGPAVHRFSGAPQIVTRRIDTVDLVPTAARLAGIRIDRPVDGINRLPEDK